MNPVILNETPCDNSYLRQLTLRESIRATNNFVNLASIH